MKNKILATWLINLSLLSYISSASADDKQSKLIHSLGEISPPVNEKNINLIPLGSNKDASDYVIFIKESVKTHYHAEHTELVYILDGTASMQLGNKTIAIKSGDYIRIPPNTIHSVQVTSSKPLKVLSIQTPEFKGKDRHFVTTK